MVTLKEYAKNQNISYEAVRKQVARYKESLTDHIVVSGKTQYLDEYAVKFLDGKRAVNAVHIIEHDKDEQIEDLKMQNENLRIKIMELQEQLIKSKDQLLERDQQLIELKDQLYLLTTKAEEDTETEVDQTEEIGGNEDDETKQPDAQPLNEPNPEKKWWQFWK